MKITWLADELRKAGVKVVEHDGWRTRAVAGGWEPRYGVVHATAAPRSQADSTQVRVVRDGRAGLSGPIANACVTRDGTWHVLSAGRCNTTVAGTAGPYRGMGNSSALGVEACNDNTGESWPDVQYRAYARGWAAICRQLRWGPGHLVGHKEHTPGHKTDPSFNMGQFRLDVTKALNGDDDMPTAKELADAVWDEPIKLPNGRISTARQILAWRDAAELDTRRQILAALATVDRVDELALAAALAPLILAGLPDDNDDPVSVDALVEAFRRLLAPPDQ